MRAQACRRHRRLGGRSWAARRAVFGRFLVAALPTPGFLSRSKVRPPTSTQVVQAERCCSRRIVGRWVRRSSSSSRWSTSTRRTSGCSCSTSFRRSSDPIRQTSNRVSAAARREQSHQRARDRWFTHQKKKNAQRTKRRGEGATLEIRRVVRRHDDRCRKK